MQGSTFQIIANIVVNPLPQNPDFQQPSGRSNFKAVREKEEKIGNKHFLLFPQYFLPYQNEKSTFYLHLLILLSANAFNLVQ